MVLADSHKASPTSRYSGYHYRIITYPYAALMLYGWVSHPIPVHFNSHIVVLQPPLCRNIVGLGSFPFARHYSGNHCYFLFLCLLRCFSSAGLRTMCGRSSTGRVSPFGNLRINLYLLIPEAYRSLSRPSSPLRAKASPVYPFLLSSTIPPFARYVCFFYSGCRLSVPISCDIFPSKANNRPICCFLFILLLPICQRTFPNTVLLP